MSNWLGKNLPQHELMGYLLRNLDTRDYDGQALPAGPKLSNKSTQTDFIEADDPIKPDAFSSCETIVKMKPQKNEVFNKRPKTCDARENYEGMIKSLKQIIIEDKSSSGDRARDDSTDCWSDTASQASIMHSVNFPRETRAAMQILCSEQRMKQPNVKNKCCRGVCDNWPQNHLD